MVYPYIEVNEDNTQTLHTEGYIIPLPPTSFWELKRHPVTEVWYVDDVNKTPGVKPRYVTTLEKRKVATARVASLSRTSRAKVVSFTLKHGHPWTVSRCLITSGLFWCAVVKSMELMSLCSKN